MEIIVNGEKISSEICNQELQNIRSQHRDASEDEQQDLAAQNIIDWTIIRQQAVKQIKHVAPQEVEDAFAELKKSHGGDEQFYQRFNITKKEDPLVKADLEQNIKVNQFLQGLTVDAPEPTADSIEKFYNENKAQFTNPKQVHAAHIVRQPNPANGDAVLDELIAIRQRLLDGEDFGTVATECSSCNDQGGDLGFFSRGSMVEEFEAVVFSMNPGEISPVFRSQFGYHIATVYAEKEQTEKTLEEATEEIKEQLSTDLKDDMISQWVDEQKKSANIEIKKDKKAE